MSKFKTLTGILLLIFFMIGLTVCKQEDIKNKKNALQVPMVFIEGITVEGRSEMALTEGDNYGAFYVNRIIPIKNFYISPVEVSQELYEKTLEGYTECNLKPSMCQGDLSTDGFENFIPQDGEVETLRPVDGVSWYDAVFFCNALSERNGFDKVYTIKHIKRNPVTKNIIKADVTYDLNKNGYRLPMEVEWEYASRGGKEAYNKYLENFNKNSRWAYTYSGSNNVSMVAWTLRTLIEKMPSENETLDHLKGYSSHQIGIKEPNSLGLYDMSGNVWEYTNDWTKDPILSRGTPIHGLKTGDFKCVRGGSWYNFNNASEVTSRDLRAPYQTDKDTGFRLCRNAEEGK